jgi:hypothetical protein
MQARGGSPRRERSAPPQYDAAEAAAATNGSAMKTMVGISRAYGHRRVSGQEGDAG